MPTPQRLHLRISAPVRDHRHPGAAACCPTPGALVRAGLALLFAAAVLALGPLRLAAQATARLPVSARVLDPAPSRLALAAVRDGLQRNEQPTGTALATIRVDSLPSEVPARSRRRVTIGFLHN